MRICFIYGSSNERLRWGIKAEEYNGGLYKYEGAFELQITCPYLGYITESTVVKKIETPI